MKLVWLRRDLRVDDNTALCEALSHGEPVACVYLATPETWENHGLAPMQADLIFRRLEQLCEELAELNIQLLYDEVAQYSDCAERVTEVATSLGANTVFVNRQYEVDECQRDDLLASQLSANGIGFRLCDDKCIFAPGSVVNKQGSYFKVFTPFKKAYLTKLEAHSFEVKKAHKAVKADLPEASRHLCFHPAVTFSYPRQESSAWAADSQSIIAQQETLPLLEVIFMTVSETFPLYKGRVNCHPT